MTKTSKIIYFFVTMIFFIFFDLYLTNFAICNSELLPSNKIIDIVFVQNLGAAFSILEGAKLFLILFSLAAAVIIIFSTLKNIKQLKLTTIFLVSLLTSGIITNMYERIHFGYVRDYIKLNFIDFPVFNISDIFINISVFAIVIIILWNKYAKTNENNN